MNQPNKINWAIIITLITMLVSVTTYAVTLRFDASLCLEEIMEVKASDDKQNDQINNMKIEFTKSIEQISIMQKDITEMKADIKSLIRKSQ